MNITVKQALEKGALAQSAGHLQEAERFYSVVLKKFPKHPEANKKMGNLAVEVGKLEQALLYFEVTLEVEPANVELWFCYIDTLIKLKKLVLAKTILEGISRQGVPDDQLNKLRSKLNFINENDNEILDQNPDAIEFATVLKLFEQKKFQDVLDEVEKLLKIYEGSSVLFNIQGASYASLGYNDQAIISFEKALKFNPNYASAHSNLGVILGNNGDLSRAIENHRAAVDFYPSANFYCKLGNALIMHNKFYDGLENLLKGLELEQTSDNILESIGMALTNKILLNSVDNLEPACLKLLERETLVRPKDIVRAITSNFKLNPEIARILKSDFTTGLKISLQHALHEISRRPAFFKIMTKCPISDMEIEILLKSIRYRILEAVVVSPKPFLDLKFLKALALQCFVNEYLYDLQPEEKELVKKLEIKLREILAKGLQPSSYEVACLACYKSLNEYDWAIKLTVDEDLKELYSRQFLEPTEEQCLVGEIPRHADISDPTSKKVRNQYEANPYPRWLFEKYPKTPLPMRNVFQDQIKILYDENCIQNNFCPQILVAGCGTGAHAIATSKRFQNCRVLAIDLSLTSLAYAKRKTRELGIKNIDFLQADICDLPSLDRTFDVIESSGVLHHMKDPLTGWRRLKECLKIGGMIKIGLYSKIARSHITEIRKEIEARGIEATENDMKAFRKEIFFSSEPHHKKILYFSDFYSLSSLRDLLFHVQEHQFTIPQIKSCINELGLKFCGFEHSQLFQQKIKIATEINDIYNLDEWHKFELNNPDFFVGMYQFWCQNS